VDNILWIYNACFEFVLKCVALFYVFCCCFSVYVVPYFSEISGENISIINTAVISKLFRIRKIINDLAIR